jgi:hypothetical protein
MVPSMLPWGVKFSHWDRLPSWNTQTRAPKVADRESRLVSTALRGISTLPSMKNSSTKITQTMAAMVQGTQ